MPTAWPALPAFFWNDCSINSLIFRSTAARPAPNLPQESSAG